MRNNKFKEFRQQFRHNGSQNKVMQVALRRSSSDEIHHANFKFSKLCVLHMFWNVISSVLW
ncbi:hypothetical protein Bca4012_066174 [Brassica carinata]